MSIYDNFSTTFDHTSGKEIAFLVRFEPMISALMGVVNDVIIKEEKTKSNFQFSSSQHPV